MKIDIQNFGPPHEFWEYFEKISSIPRCSGKEEKIRAYIEKEAKYFNFPTITDNVGNLLVTLTLEKKVKSSPKIILQAHMDMVCEKNESSTHDFLKDPLKIKLIKIDDEEWLTAEGTTLGADNGVGIAYCLTLMKKIHNNELEEMPLNLDLLFTVDEESGLVGAFNIDKELIKCDYLINLDSEEDDRFTIGCAGGANTFGVLDYKGEHINKFLKNDMKFKLVITGLIGGHSGVDIHRGRGNAIKLLGKILYESDNHSIFLQELQGGNRLNSIPREAKAIFHIDKAKKDEIMNSLEKVTSEIKNKFQEIEPNLEIKIEQIESNQKDTIIPDQIKYKLIELLYNLPNGPISMHPEIAGLVHTSTNLAYIDITPEKSDIKTSQRSLEEDTKKEIQKEIETFFESTGLNFQISSSGGYPGWNPDFNSNLLLKAKKTYKNLFNQEVIVQAVHAGLECGILKKHYPEMEAISIGPTIKGPHSPDESLQIKSVKKIWDFLVKLLQDLKA